MNTLQISKTTDGGWAIVSASGEVDVATSPELLAALEDASTRSGKLIIDLSGVTFMDSTGLGVVVQAKRAFEADDALRLVVKEANVRKVFEVTGLDSVLPLFETREAALAG